MIVFEWFAQTPLQFRRKIILHICYSDDRTVSWLSSLLVYSLTEGDAWMRMGNGAMFCIFLAFVQMCSGIENAFPCCPGPGFSSCLTPHKKKPGPTLKIHSNAIQISVRLSSKTQHFHTPGGMLVCTWEFVYNYSITFKNKNRFYSHFLLLLLFRVYNVLMGCEFRS